MRSAAELLTTARGTMLKWPALWFPPILMNMAQSLSGIPLTNSGLQAASAVMANLGAMLINAGWIAMIGLALQGEKPTYASFMDGLNRRWGAIALGSLFFVLLLAGLMGGLIWYGDAQYGVAGLREWYESIAKLTAPELNAALQPDKLPEVIRSWMTLLMIWMTGAAALTFLLLYWQPLVVLRDMPWWKAWGVSVKIVFTRFGLSAGIGLLHLFAFGAGLSITAGGGALLALFGLTMLLFVTIFFKILYAAVVDDTLPAPGAKLDVEA